MANAEANTAVAGANPTVKVPMLPLLLGALAAAVLAVGAAGGAVYFLAKSGRLHLGGGNSETVVKAAVKVPTHPMAMEPMLANLSDADGHAYLRLGVVLQVEDGEKKGKEEKKEAKGPSPEEAALRDTILEVLGSETSAQLLAPDGKEQLKKKLLESFSGLKETPRVQEVFFTEFLVQR